MAPAQSKIIAFFSPAERPQETNAADEAVSNDPLVQPGRTRITSARQPPSAMATIAGQSDAGLGEAVNDCDDQTALDSKLQTARPSDYADLSDSELQSVLEHLPDLDDESQDEEGTDGVAGQPAEVVRRDGQHEDLVNYLESQGVRETWTRLYSILCQRPGLPVVIDKKAWDNADLLQSIGGDTQSMGYGWYANIVTQTGRPDYLKMYIGQARILKVRTNKHKSCIRAGGYARSRALHYRIAGGQGRVSTFVLLGEVQRPYGPSPQPLKAPLLDLGEMYLCLLFQTLPQRTLRHYLPSTVPVRRTQIGLNVASPLNQNARDAQERSKREIAKLKDSSDPEVRQYLSDMTKEARAAALVALEEQRFVPISQALRKVSKKQHLFRGPDPGLQYEQYVQIICGRCRSDETKTTDPDPLFRASDGTYLAREQRCMVCTPQKGRKYSTRLFHPLDGRQKLSFNKLK